MAAHSGHVHGLSQLKIGETVIGHISDEGIDWGGSEPTTQQIFSAQNPGSPVIELTDNPGSDELSFKLIELKPENLAIVLGGSVQVNKWLASKTKTPIIDKAEIKTADGTTIKIGKVSLIAFFRGKITGKELLTVQCKMTILDDGTANPFTVEFPAG